MDHLALPSDEFQRLFMAAYLHDRPFALSYLEWAKPSYFTASPSLRWLLEHSSDFLTTYREVIPPNVLAAEIELAQGTGKLNDAEVDDVLAVYDRVRGTYDNPAERALIDYVRQTAGGFLQRQALVEFAQHTVEHIQRGEVDERIVVEAQAALAVGQTIDQSDLRDLFADRERFVEVFTAVAGVRFGTGILELDDLVGGGIGRKELAALLAPTGRGKSHWLVNLVVALIRDGHNVLHVTLELSRVETLVRYYARLSGVPSQDFRKGRLQEAMALVDEQAATTPGRLIVEEYPTRTLSVPALRAAIQRLADYDNFVPDVLVLDYADLLKQPSSSRDDDWKQQQINYELLRGLCQELNIACYTAAQSNRAGHSVDELVLEQIGDSYAKARVCDLIIGLAGDPRRQRDTPLLPELTLTPLKVRTDALRGSLRVQFDGSTSRFIPVAAAPPPVAAQLPDAAAFGQPVR